MNLLGEGSIKETVEKNINSLRMSEYKKLIYSEFKFFYQR